MNRDNYEINFKFQSTNYKNNVELHDIFGLLQKPKYASLQDAALFRETRTSEFVNTT